jgi:cytidylate kinase
MAGERFSIVISGWPAVGKTTIAHELAKEFGLSHYNGGDILKMLAAEKGYSTDTSKSDWWDTQEAKKFMAERKRDPTFDKKVDRRLEKILKTEGAVITSYKGSPHNRARRMANRDRIPAAEAERVIKMRDEENKRIYRKLYGFSFGDDLSVFDYALNTDRLGLDSLIEIAKVIVRRHTGR